MNVDATVWVGAAGLVVGAAAALIVRARSGPGKRVQEGVVPALPPGIADVLSVLRSASVLLDASDAVVRASPTAYAYGLVRGERLTSAELLRLVRLVRRAGEIESAELDIPRGPLGGETLAVSARVAPLGELVLVLVEDRAEQRRVDAVRRDFVANVSHELKTPVGALILLAEAVLGASDEPAAVRRFAGRMQHEATRLSMLVQELIDLSRLQGDDPLSEADVVELDQVVAEAVDHCRLSAGARRIGLVSGGESGLTVVGDEEQLVTAVRNLVDNAVNYSPDNTRVAVGVRRAADLVEISITDQGIGIPEDDLERIFERFYRVDTARSRMTGGTGLGLSIVKHIAANHGGEVTVWSVEGAGSTFTIRLPAGGEPSPERSAETADVQEVAT